MLDYNPKCKVNVILVYGEIGDLSMLINTEETNLCEKDFQLISVGTLPLRIGNTIPLP